MLQPCVACLSDKQQSPSHSSGKPCACWKVHIASSEIQLPCQHGDAESDIGPPDLVRNPGRRTDFLLWRNTRLQQACSGGTFCFHRCRSCPLPVQFLQFCRDDRNAETVRERHSFKCAPHNGYLRQQCFKHCSIYSTTVNVCHKRCIPFSQGSLDSLADLP